MSVEVRNILKVYRQATDEEVQRGITWYVDARARAQAISSGIPLHVVVGVIAALSPNNKWSRNLYDAEAMIAAFKLGKPKEVCKPCTYTKMRDKAWHILEAMPDTPEGVEVILKGQKIVSFFRNIMGQDTCTIDGHAYNIAKGKRLTLSKSEITMSKSAYLDLQAAYTRAAKRVRLKVYELQAITWVVWKRIHNI